MYDMHELALSNIKTTSQFPATKKGVELMNRPVMLFQGDAFESDAQLSELKGLFLDMYQHQSLGKINLAGLEHAVVLTAKGSKVAFRHYSISLKKSGERVPKIQLEEIGPSFDMEVRRQQLPSAQVRYDFPAPILLAQSQQISSLRISFKWLALLFLGPRSSRGRR
jgi:ribosome production factor 2